MSSPRERWGLTLHSGEAWGWGRKDEDRELGHGCTTDALGQGRASVILRAQGLSLDALNQSSEVAAPEEQRGSGGRRLFPDRDWAEGYGRTPPQAAE